MLPPSQTHPSLGKTSIWNRPIKFTTSWCQISHSTKYTCSPLLCCFLLGLRCTWVSWSNISQFFMNIWQTFHNFSQTSDKHFTAFHKHLTNISQTFHNPSKTSHKHFTVFPQTYNKHFTNLGVLRCLLFGLRWPWLSWSRLDDSLSPRSTSSRNW